VHANSRENGLIIRAVKFHVAISVRKRYAKQTDGQTDRQTDITCWHYPPMTRVKMSAKDRGSW